MSTATTLERRMKQRHATARRFMSASFRKTGINFSSAAWPYLLEEQP